MVTPISMAVPFLFAPGLAHVGRFCAFGRVNSVISTVMPQLPSRNLASVEAAIVGVSPVAKSVLGIQPGEPFQLILAEAPPLFRRY